MKATFAICLFIIPFTMLWSQESYVDSVLNEVMYYDEDELFYMEIEENKTVHFIYANSTYNNKTFYAGREVANPQYYLAGQLSYFNSLGFFIGLGTSSGNWFEAGGEANYNNALVLGYGKALKKQKWFRYNISYSRFFGIKEGLNVSSTYSNSVHAGLGLKYKWIGARMGLNTLFGNDSKTTFNWEVYSPVTLIKWQTFNYIKLEPQLSFFYDSEEVKQSVVRNKITYTSKFGLLNTELNLPLVINLNDFDFELAYSINIPRSLDPAYSYDKTSFFTFSIGYIFEL